MNKFTMGGISLHCVNHIIHYKEQTDAKHLTSVINIMLSNLFKKQPVAMTTFLTYSGNLLIQCTSSSRSSR